MPEQLRIVSELVLRVHHEYCQMLAEPYRPTAAEVVEFIWLCLEGGLERRDLFPVLKLVWGCHSFAHEKKLRQAVDRIRRELHRQRSGQGQQAESDAEAGGEDSSFSSTARRSRLYDTSPTSLSASFLTLSELQGLPGYPLTPPRLLSEKELGKQWKRIGRGYRRTPTQELDARAMIDECSRTGVWQPCYHSRRRHRISALVVLDHSATLAPFRRQIGEVIQSLENYSGFSIQRLEFASGAPPRASECLKLLDRTPPGLARRLTLLFSDGVSEMWMTEAAEQFFRQIAEVSELVWIIPYPPPLAEETILGCCLERLEISGPRKKETSFSVLSCTVEGLRQIGNQPGAMPQCYFYQGLPVEVRDNISRRIAASRQDAGEWAQRVIATMSPPAFSLACLAAALPIFDADLLHLLRQYFLPGAHLHHEAQFYCSGLVKAQGPAFKVKSAAAGFILASPRFKRLVSPLQLRSIYRYLREYIDKRQSRHRDIWRTAFTISHSVANAAILDTMTIAAEPAAAALAAMGIGVPQPAGFSYSCTQTYSCGGQTHTVHEYRHDQTGMEFVLIPGGSFMMGSDNGRGDEKPCHQVELSSYLIGKYPCRQREWQAVMGSNPSHFEGAERPVERVSWKNCQEFCRRTRLRLPTEAQWEYACRGGNSGEYCFGDDAAQLGDYAWYTGNSGKCSGYFNARSPDYSEWETHPVGEKMPNAYGLYDMHGNVWDWCADWYGKYPQGKVTDPTGPNNGSNRVLRGGSFRSKTMRIRSAYRNRRNPENCHINLGVRLGASFSGGDCRAIRHEANGVKPHED